MKRFTLIEMLAVVVVILVLASMLMPALLQSRKLGRQAVCVSNLKQISTLEMLYAGNNRNWVTPTSAAGAPTTPTVLIAWWTTWDDVLGVLYDGRNLVPSDVNLQVVGITPTYPTPITTSWIYNCPLDKRSTKELVARSYVINVEISQSLYGGDGIGTNLTKIPNPGQTILFAERIVSASIDANGWTTGAVIGNDELAAFSNKSRRFFGTGSVTYCDVTADRWTSNHPRKDYLPWLFVDGHVELQNRSYFPDFKVQ